MKQCRTCLEWKVLSDFYKEKSLKDGHMNHCKICRNKNVEKWRHNNRNKYNADMRAYNKKHYERLRIQRYELSQDEYQQMLKTQNNQCAICGKKQSGKRPLAIDHDHKNNKVRSLLCYNCNRGMHFIDNEELLKKMLKYKAKFSK